MDLIKFKINTGKENMAIDSQILENAIEESRPSPIFRLYGWSPACISLGRNQNDKFTENIRNFDIVRRLTGGRALLHDDEITYSCIFPISFIPGGESIIESYKFISGILIDFFKTLGINLDFGGGEIPKKHPHLSKIDYCMMISTGADVCFNGKKIIGSAQFRKNGYILQHGSILYDYDKELLSKIFSENISDDSITCIKEILPDMTKEEFIFKLENYLKNLKF